MKKNLAAFVLTCAVLCTMALPTAWAADTTASPTASPAAEAIQPLPESVLYYGILEKIIMGNEDAIIQLRMDSERYGEYTMNISPKTVWIDSGTHLASDPATLTEGERLYVFHSPVSTLSLPPQSAALAVVRNLPQDVGCPQYHKVEAASLEENQLKITTDNGGLHILVDDKTGLSHYDASIRPTLKDIEPGDHVMAWYEAYAASYPGQTYATHLMLLPEMSETDADTAPLTRSQLTVMLHEKAGKPVVNYAMDYTDVSGSAEYAEAIRWATSKGFICGYGNGKFGPDDKIQRQQLMTILWRCAGKPMLMDYPGLMRYEDVADIAHYAQQAMIWAHQKGLIGTDDTGILDPLGAVTEAEAIKLVQSIEIRK